jgi:hypothetical protein
MGEDSVEKRLQSIRNAMNSPCRPGEHDYQHSVVSFGKGTMMQQFCSKCFDMAAWIHDWQDPKDQEHQ